MSRYTTRDDGIYFVLPHGESVQVVLTATNGASEWIADALNFAVANGFDSTEKVQKHNGKRARKTSAFCLCGDRKIKNGKHGNGLRCRECCRVYAEAKTQAVRRMYPGDKVKQAYQRLTDKQRSNVNAAGQRAVAKRQQK